MSQKIIETAHIWSGMHGEEQEPGPPLVDSLNISPIQIAGKSLTADIMHPRAVALNRRYLDVDLSECLADPSFYAGTVEAALAPQVLETSKDKDFVADMHAQNLSEKDYAYLGPRFRTYMLGFVALSGMREVILATGGVHGQLLQAVTLDITPGSHRNNTDYWRDILTTMLTDGLAASPLDQFTFYAHDNMSKEMRMAAGVVSGRSYSPLEPLQNLKTQFGTTPLALYGCNAEYAGPLEVVAPLDSTHIKIENEIVTAPTLDIKVS